MRVILCNPPVPEKEIWVREGRCQQFDIWGTPFPPLSLAYIAGQLKDEHPVRIIDSGPARLGLNKTILEISKFNPDLVIISTATPTVETDLGWFVDRLKERIPDVTIAAFGIHVSVLSEECLRKFKKVDFIIRGEPEITSLELVNMMEENNAPDEIDGLSYRKGGKICINRERRLVNPLDSLNFPYWNGIDFNRYKMPIMDKPFNLIALSRGCPHRCKFCNIQSYYGKTFRKRDPELVADEIIENMKRGIFDFLFWTESITTDLDYLIQVIEVLKRRQLHKKIKWVSNSRIDFTDYNTFTKMKEAGCWQIVFGIEFGNDEILRAALKARRPLVEEGKRAVEAARKAGLVVDGHFILGFPGETIKTLKDTIDLACSLPLHFAHFYAATPFPGSQLYTEAVQNEWLVRNEWKYFSQDIVNIKTETLTPETVYDYISFAYRKFYFRLIVMLRIMRIAKNFTQIKSIVLLTIRFIVLFFMKKHTK